MPSPDHLSSAMAHRFAALQQFKQLWKAGSPPDLLAYVAASAPLSDEQLSSIVRVDLSRRWVAGRTLPVEWYLARFERLASLPELAVDLVYTEFLQAEKYGTPMSHDDVILRFPQYTQTLQQQFELHDAIDSNCGTSAVATPSDRNRELHESPRQFPRVPGYTILEELGRGGVGVVYRAHDPRLNRMVALKLLLSGAHASATQRRRVQIEAEAFARLQHGNIVQIYEIGEHEGRPYLVLEFVSGGNLAEHDRGQPHNPRWSAALVEQLARTIEFAHQHGILHRDLKPANVLLVGYSSEPNVEMAKPQTDSDGSGGRSSSCSGPSHPYPKITDFGLAKLFDDIREAPADGATCTGDLLGTPSYMSPEQAAGKTREIGVATDVYALGAILYDLLTGRAPFVGTTPVETLRQVIESEPIHPSRLVREIPIDLQTICLKCLEKEPRRRYASSSALAEDLVRFLTDRPILARRTTRFERAWRWCRRNPLITSLLGSITGLVTLVAVVASVLSLLLSEQLAETKSAERAERSAKSAMMERLWDSFLAETRAHRSSRQVGQRFAGLNAINSARNVSHTVPLSMEQRAALRDSAIACLALPDLRRIREWRADLAGLPTNPGSISDGNMDRYVYQTADGAVQVCRVGDGKAISRLPKQPASSRLMLSPHGQYVGVYNSRFQVWRIDGAEPQLTLDVAAGGWWSFSPDCRTVVGSTADGILRIADVESGRMLRDLGVAVSDMPIAISPDGSLAALIVENEIRVIDLHSGLQRHVISIAEALPANISLSWHPHNETITAAPFEDGMQVWNVQTGTKQAAIAHGSAFLTASDETGELFISHSPWDGVTRLWDGHSRKPWLSSSGTAFLEIKPAAGGGFRLMSIAAPDRCALWEVAPQRIYRTADWTTELGNWPIQVGFSPDGQLLAISAEEGLSIVDTRNVATLASIDIGFSRTYFDVDGHLITASSAGLFQWESRTTNRDSSQAAPSVATSIEFVPPEFPQHPEAQQADGMAISFDGRMAAVVVGDEVLVWRVDQPDPPRRYGPHTDVRSIAFSPNGKWLATGGWEEPGGAKIWDLASGNLITELPVGGICSVTFSPDGRYFATSPRGGEIWRTDDWQRHLNLGSTDTWNTGLQIRFSPDGSVLAVATSTGTIRFVDPESGRKLFILTDPNQHRVRDCAFSPDGKQLATVCNDDGGAVHIWDLGRVKEELDRLGFLWSNDLPKTAFGSIETSRTTSSIDGPRSVTFGRHAWIAPIEE